MTNMPEAKLAREAELPYATVAMVTDYDCWHPGHDHVDVASVLRVLKENLVQARALLKRVIPELGPNRTPSPAFIERALDSAIITAPEARDPARVEQLRAIASRVLGDV
jgi:5'-methylthioadenosine phosphorylase